jgi:hypothetical protein
VACALKIRYATRHYPPKWDAHNIIDLDADRELDNDEQLIADSMTTLREDCRVKLLSAFGSYLQNHLYYDGRTAPTVNEVVDMLNKVMKRIDDQA